MTPRLLNLLLKIAGILPPPSAVANAVKKLPLPGRTPVISAAFKGGPGAVAGKGFTAAHQFAETVRPGLQFADTIHPALNKVAHMNYLETVQSSFFDELDKIAAWKAAGVPPPLPAAARLATAVKKPLAAAANPMADALFSGMRNAPKTNVLSTLVKKGHEKVALNKLLGELVKQQKDPARLANISRLATSRGAQLAGEGASSAKKYLAVGTAAAQRMAKAAAAGGTLSRLGKALGSTAGDHAIDLAGLGVLAVPGADTLQSKLRGTKPMLSEGAHAAADVAGLGILAAPVAHKLLRGGH